MGVGGAGHPPGNTATSRGKLEPWNQWFESDDYIVILDLTSITRIHRDPVVEKLPNNTLVSQLLGAVGTVSIWQLILAVGLT